MNNILWIIWDISPYMQIGSQYIRLYSLMFAIGMLFGGAVVIRLMKNYSSSESYILYAFGGILIGARLFHCLCYDPIYFMSHITEIFLPLKKIDGSTIFVGYNGLSSHGGIVGLMISLMIYAKRNKINYLNVYDIFAIATPITGFFIRLGNLMNSEILGKYVDLPFSFVFTNIDNIPRHPVQLYEAIYYFLFFILMVIIYQKNGFNRYKGGYYTGIAFLGIAIFRFFIEYFKENQESFISPITLNMGQILSIPFVIVGVILIKISKKNL